MRTRKTYPRQKVIATLSEEDLLQEEIKDKVDIYEARVSLFFALSIIFIFVYFNIKHQWLVVKDALLIQTAYFQTIDLLTEEFAPFIRPYFPFISLTLGILSLIAFFYNARQLYKFQKQLKPLNPD